MNANIRHAPPVLNQRSPAPPPPNAGGGMCGTHLLRPLKRTVRIWRRSRGAARAFSVERTGRKSAVCPVSGRRGCQTLGLGDKRLRGGKVFLQDI